ncbi:hypothetical protein, partial [Kitasatospora sp. NPDC093558]|uniref:hypothetical protein n=1 Tax=Kitasatospora sp. NPDC093558 TaxID=3155201 RepID=UPI0034435F7B
MSGSVGYADCVLFVLDRARREARSGGAAEVEPDHLLIGLGALCRADLADLLVRRGLDEAAREAVAGEAARVRECFDRAGVHPRVLRRSLRTALAEGAEGGAVGAVGAVAAGAARVVHRSRASYR